MTILSTRVHVKADRETTFEHLIAFETYPEFAKPIRRVVRDPDRDNRLEFVWVRARSEETHRVDVQLDHSNTTLYWQSVDGTEHAGSMVVTELTDERSAVSVKVDLHPSGPLNQMSSAVGVVQGRFEHHLHEFAAYVEERTGRRPLREAADHRAPSEKLFDAVFPTDETTRGR